MKKKSKGKWDARPVGARRPRYAASGEVACTGDGEDGRDPMDEPKETSGDELLNASV
jgi:hypothetical protein